MVKFFYERPMATALKHVLDKSLWVKIKTLHKYAYESNPTLTYFVLPIYPVLLIASGILTYYKTKCDLRPKYYEYYRVMRPDDPNVKYIRHDDSVRVAEPVLNVLNTAR